MDDDEEIKWEDVALPAARWTEYARLGIPLWTLIPVFGGPVLLALLTRNWAWGLLWLVTPGVTRSIYGEDQNKPRQHWLSFRSGQMFANRMPWGGASRDPLDV